MIGTILRFDGDEVLVDCPLDYPGQELPCRRLTHRIAEDTFAAYQAGDQVFVMKVNGVFMVMGIYQ